MTLSSKYILSLFNRILTKFQEFTFKITELAVKEKEKVLDILDMSLMSLKSARYIRQEMTVVCLAHLL